MSGEQIADSVRQLRVEDAHAIADPEDRAAADRLQVKGFFADVLARFRHPGLEPPLRRAAMAKYAGIMERNRA